MEHKTQKKFVNYFTKWEGAGVTGLSMLGVGFLFLWLGFSYFSYIASIVLMAGGAALFFYGNVGRANEADLQSIITNNKATVVFPESTETDHARYRNESREKYEEHEFEGYILKNGLWLKKLKSGALCSSEYFYAKMRLLPDSLWIKAVDFSLINDEKEATEYHIAADALEDITVERARSTVTSANKKAFLAKTCYLILVYDGGKRLSLPAGDDIYTDEFIEKLKKIYLSQK